MPKGKRASKKVGQAIQVRDVVAAAKDKVTKATNERNPAIGKAVQIALSKLVRFAEEMDRAWNLPVHKSLQADLDQAFLSGLADFTKQATAALELLAADLQRTGNGKVALAHRVEARKLIATACGMRMMRRTFAKIALRTPRETSGASVLIPYFTRLKEIGYELQTTWEELQPRVSSPGRGAHISSAGSSHPDSWVSAAEYQTTLATFLSTINRAASSWRTKAKTAARPTWRGPSASIYRVADLIAAIEGVSQERFAKIAFPHGLSKKLLPKDYEPPWAFKATIAPSYFKRPSKSTSKVRRK